jgi:hypothetical protein
MTTGSVVISTAVTSTAVTSTAAASDDMPAGTDRGADADVRDGSKQLRDIEELIAKLAIVTQQLAVPARTMTSPRPADAGQSAAHEN